MTDRQNADADWILLVGGWTAEGLLSQCQRWQERTDGTYFSSGSSRRTPFENDPDRSEWPSDDMI